VAVVAVQCPMCGSHKVVKYGQQPNGAQRYRCNSAHCPRTGRQPDDSDEHPQKKAAALHSVNPALGTAREGLLPAVVIHKV
jgi:hypothetical protein